MYAHIPSKGKGHFILTFQFDFFIELDTKTIKNKEELMKWNWITTSCFVCLQFPSHSPSIPCQIFFPFLCSSAPWLLLVAQLLTLYMSWRWKRTDLAQKFLVIWFHPLGYLNKFALFYCDLEKVFSTIPFVSMSTAIFVSMVTQQHLDFFTCSLWHALNTWA